MNEESPGQLSAERDSSAIADSFPLGKQLEFRDTTKYPYKGMDIKDLVSLPGNFPNCILNYIVNPKEKFHIYLCYL